MASMWAYTHLHSKPCYPSFTARPHAKHTTGRISAPHSREGQIPIQCSDYCSKPLCEAPLAEIRNPGDCFLMHRPPGAVSRSHALRTAFERSRETLTLIRSEDGGRQGEGWVWNVLKGRRRWMCYPSRVSSARRGQVNPTCRLPLTGVSPCYAGRDNSLSIKRPTARGSRSTERSILSQSDHF